MTMIGSADTGSADTGSADTGNAEGETPATGSTETSPPAPDPAPPRADQWAFGPLLRRLHFYVGVLVGPFLLVAALTGLAYTITPQLDQLAYGDQLRVSDVGANALPLAEQVARAETVVPDGEVIIVVPPASEDATTRVVFAVPELADKQRTVYVDPYTGQATGVLTTWWGSTPLTTWLDDLHRHLHLGEPGRLYSELAASWLWVLALGGLVLWWRHQRHQRGRRRVRRMVRPELTAGKGVRRTRSWHASTGVWLLVGLLLLSATGLTWSQYAGARFDLVQDQFDAHRLSPDTTLPETPGERHGEAGHGDHAAAGGTGEAAELARVDTVLAAARGHGLDGPVEITPAAGAAWTVAQVDNVWPVRRDAVAVDPSTGAITDEVRWADQPLLARLSSLGVYLHMGILFGPANQVGLAAVAVGLLLVIVWGYRMWWQRRPTRADRRRPLGAPPARGGWRRLPWPVLAVTIVAVAAIGWAMPLLGWTLLGFLIIDVVVGVVAGQVARRRALRRRGYADVVGSG